MTQEENTIEEFNPCPDLDFSGVIEALNQAMESEGKLDLVGDSNNNDY